MTPCTLNLNHRDVAGWIQPYVQMMCPGDYTVLCLFYQGNGFVFDRALADSLSGKELVILDMQEYGWDRSFANINVMGVCMEEQPLYPEVEEYHKLCNWIAHQKVIAYFKREMTKGCISNFFPIYPIDLLSFNRGRVPTPRREEFLSRKGGVFFLYGNSHPDRLALHGALQTVRNSASNSIGVAQRVMASGYETDLLEQVHFAARYPLSTVIEAQGQFKLSIALGGCGNKSFRTSEVLNAVPVINDVGMIYSVQWTNENALMLPTRNGRLDIELAVKIIGNLDSEDAWIKMQGAYQSALELEPANYVNHHINRHILATL